MIINYVPFFFGKNILLINLDETKYSSWKDWYYSYYLQSDYWNNLKQKALDYFSRKCFKCNREEDLQCHHTNYKCLGKEIIGKDIVVLCGKHHSKIHGIRNHKNKTTTYINLDPITVKKLKKLFTNYKKEKKLNHKNKIKNAIYSICNSYVLNKTKKYFDYKRKEAIENYVEVEDYSDQEILSISWDSFCYWLEKAPLKSKYSFTKTFNKYVMYGLQSINNQKEKEKFSSIEMLDINDFENKLRTEPDVMVFNKLANVYRFRSIIPIDHITTWDDAFMSLSKEDKHNKQSKDYNGLTQAAYFNLKRTYKNIITYLIKE